MDKSKLSSEWIQTFNRLGSEGKLKPTVPYHDLFSRKELKGFPLHTLPMWTVNFPTGHITCCDPLVTYVKETLLALYEKINRDMVQ